MVESETADEMTRRLPRMQLVEIADAAHDLHLDRPNEWQDTLIDFLNSLD